MPLPRGTRPSRSSLGACSGAMLPGRGLPRTGVGDSFPTRRRVVGLRTGELHGECGHGSGGAGGAVGRHGGTARGRAAGVRARRGVRAERPGSGLRHVRGDADPGSGHQGDAAGRRQKGRRRRAVAGVGHGRGPQACRGHPAEQGRPPLAARPCLRRPAHVGAGGGTPQTAARQPLHGAGGRRGRRRPPLGAEHDVHHQGPAAPHHRLLHPRAPADRRHRHDPLDQVQSPRQGARGCRARRARHRRPRSRGGAALVRELPAGLPPARLLEARHPRHPRPAAARGARGPGLGLARDHVKPLSGVTLHTSVDVCELARGSYVSHTEGERA